MKIGYRLIPWPLLWHCSKVNDKQQLWWEVNIGSATSPYLSQCQSKSMTPYGINRPHVMSSLRTSIFHKHSLDSCWWQYLIFTITNYHYKSASLSTNYDKSWKLAFITTSDFILYNLCRLVGIWGLMWQKQVSRAGTSNYIPKWDVITCPCPWYLFLPHKSSYNHEWHSRRHKSGFSDMGKT